MRIQTNQVEDPAEAADLADPIKVKEMILARATARIAEIVQDLEKVAGLDLQGQHYPEQLKSLEDLFCLAGKNLILLIATATRPDILDTAPSPISHQQEVTGPTGVIVTDRLTSPSPRPEVTGRTHQLPKAKEQGEEVCRQGNQQLLQGFKIFLFLNNTRKLELGNLSGSQIQIFYRFRATKELI